MFQNNPDASNGGGRLFKLDGANIAIVINDIFPPVKSCIRLVRTE